MTENRPHSLLRLGALICIHIVSCCVSLVYLADHMIPVAFDPATYHIFFYPAQSYIAFLVVAAFALLSLLFIFSSFSFGYFVSFYFYTMVLNYLWLNCFTDLNYGHMLAGFSAAASAAAFLLPALFISSPVRQRYALSEMAFDRVLTFILLFAVGAIAAGAAYNFQLVGIEDIYGLRNKLKSPIILNYLIGITSSTLLPFAFAGLATRRYYWRAGAVLLLLLFFYPITLSKLALFNPLWLVVILLLSRLLEARTAIVLSVLVPMLAGLVLGNLFGSRGALFFSTINFRMIAIPAVAMDVYNDFFPGMT